MPIGGAIAEKSKNIVNPYRLGLGIKKHSLIKPTDERLSLAIATEMLSSNKISKLYEHIF